jgi:hypothetical protein
MPEKKPILIDTGRIFYNDFTYRCDYWAEGDYSRWKIEDNRFMFSRASSGGLWLQASSAGPLCSTLRAALDDEIDKILLEGE